MNKVLVFVLAAALVLSFSVVATTPAAAQTTYYVATTGDNGNDGSAGSPWLTIQHAIDTVAEGDTIMVAAGTYDEIIDVNKDNLTLIGNPSDRPVIDGKGAFIVVKLWADGVTFQGFEVTGQQLTADPKLIDSDGQGNQILDNYVRATPGQNAVGGVGIYLRATRNDNSGTMVKSNEVDGGNTMIYDFGGPQVGMYFYFGINSRAVDVEITDNTAYNCIYAICVDPYAAFGGYAGEVRGNTAHSALAGFFIYRANSDDQAEISGNTARDNTHGMVVSGASALGSRNLLIHDNDVEDNENGLVIGAYDSSDVTVTDNRFFRNAGHQIRDSADPGPAVDLEEALVDNTFDRAAVVRGSDIKVPTIFSSIQDAIAAADPGDTVEVLAGYYEENLAAWKDMEIIKSLTLRGAGSGETVVGLTQGKMNGVEIRGSGLSVTIEGITFTKRPGADHASNYGLRIAETASTFTSLVLKDVEVGHAHAANVHLGGVGTFDSVTVEDCNFHHAGTWGFLASGQINSMTVRDSDFEYCGQVDAGHGIGFDLAGPGPFTDITVTGGSFSHNTHTGLLVLQASDVTIKGIVANHNAGHPGAGFGIRIDEWQGKTQDVLIEDVTASYNALDGIAIQPEKDDAIENVTIIGATLSHNGRDGLGLWYIHSGTNNPEMTGVSITFSNIFGNAGYGVRVEAWWVPMPIPEVFDATHNWWGAADGPTTSPGSGDRVSANVDYDHWLGAPLYLPAVYHDTLTAGAHIVDASAQADTVVEFDTTGPTQIYVARYESQPFPDEAFPDEALGKYIDIQVSNPENVVWPVYVRVYYTTAEINAAGIDEKTLGLYYYSSEDGGFHRCSDTGVNTAEKFIWANITAEEAGYLAGSPFGAGGNPLPPPQPPTAGLAYPIWAVLLAGLMAGATLLALRRRQTQS